MSLVDRIFNRKPTLAPIIPNYPLLWGNCSLDKDSYKNFEIEAALKIYSHYEERYHAVALKASINPFLIFCLHYKESDCSFTAALHNGDAVIGNGKRTYNVPKGRGPFATWEEAAIDALTYDGYKRTHLTGRYIPTLLEGAERWNGLGHRSHGKLSPYVWSYTNNSDEVGNFTSDGKYSENSVIKSAGVAALFKRAIETGAIATDSSGDWLV